MAEDTDWFSPDTATFGDRLAGAREQAGLTQAELAKRLGVKVKTIRAWEEDLSEPRANKLQMLSGLLNVSLTWLLNAEGDGPSGPYDETAAPEIDKLFVELRQVKSDLVQTTERLGRLEKQLRGRLREHM